MDDFQAHLLAFEMRLDSQAAVIGVATSVTNVAGHNFNSCSSSRGRSYCGRGHDRFGSRLPSPNQASPCQICGRKNHATPTYWYRYEQQS